MRVRGVRHTDEVFVYAIIRYNNKDGYFQSWEGV